VNLTANPHQLCVHLEIPFQVALGFAPDPASVASRHIIEVMVQTHFMTAWPNACVINGGGCAQFCNIFLVTDHPVKALTQLMDRVFQFAAADGVIDLRPYLTLGWFDDESKVWRTVLFKPIDLVTEGLKA
jgi:hypothetical protein